jgi:hypothetical protein
MTNYNIREVREGDLLHLASNLRGADIREFVAAYGHPRVLEGLEASVSNSKEARVADDTVNPVAIWGYNLLSAETAAIWCVASHEIYKLRRAFVRESRAILKRWFQENPQLRVMVNFAHADNHTHLYWLKSVGAEVLPATPMGALMQPFRPFIIPRENHV